MLRACSLLMVSHSQNHSWQALSDHNVWTLEKLGSIWIHVWQTPYLLSSVPWKVNLKSRKNILYLKKREFFPSLLSKQVNYFLWNPKISWGLLIELTLPSIIFFLYLLWQTKSSMNYIAYTYFVQFLFTLVCSPRKGRVHTCFIYCWALSTMSGREHIADTRTIYEMNTWRLSFKNVFHKM